MSSELQENVRSDIKSFIKHMQGGDPEKASQAIKSAIDGKVQIEYDKAYSKVILNESHSDYDKKEFIETYGEYEDIVKGHFSPKLLKYIQNYHLGELPIQKIKTFEDLDYYLGQYGVEYDEIADGLITMLDTGQWAFEPEE